MKLKSKFSQALETKRPSIQPTEFGASGLEMHETADEFGESPDCPEDVLETYMAAVIESIKSDQNVTHVIQCIRDHGIPWKGLMEEIKKHLPDIIHDPNQFAYNSVKELMDGIYGQDNWATERRESRNGKDFTTWIILR